MLYTLCGVGAVILVLVMVLCFAAFAGSCKVSGRISRQEEARWEAHK